jgi:hypothetical protein
LIMQYFYIIKTSFNPLVAGSSPARPTKLNQ